MQHEAPQNTDTVLAAIDTPVGSVQILNSSLANIAQDRSVAKERFANFLTPTLEQPTEIWEAEYDDGSYRQHFIKVFGMDDLGIVAFVVVQAAGHVLLDMDAKTRAELNDLRVGKLLYQEA
ncbi:MAG TPA: PBECR2 nuclease fold domain-containing protein [Burkholderiaceae bacterium]|nr:PBECR2 nuclease fold domain-containing protein [Burkholderiaceae bacterium]